MTTPSLRGLRSASPTPSRGHRLRPGRAGSAAIAGPAFAALFAGALATTGRLARRIFGAGVLCQWLFAGTAWAQQPTSAVQDAVAAHAQAAQAFDALRVAHPERMPRLADEEGGALLRTLGDAPRFLDAVPYGPNDLGVLSAVCDRASGAIVAYASFGIALQAPIAVADVARNVLAYQDELAVLQPFWARCIARQVPVTEALARQLGDATIGQLRLGGLARAQSSIVQLYTALAGSFADTRFQRNYRDALLQALAAVAPTHARAMSLAARHQVIDLVQPLLLQATGAERAALQRVLQAMGDSRCSGLCRWMPAPS